MRQIRDFHSFDIELLCDMKCWTFLVRWVIDPKNESTGNNQCYHLTKNGCLVFNDIPKNNHKLQFYVNNIKR